MRAPRATAVVVCLALLVVAGPSVYQNQCPEFLGSVEGVVGDHPQPTRAVD